MGSCRFFNVLLGASTITEPVWEYQHLLHAAAGLGVYIMGVTWFARTEATESKRNQLVMAMAVINLGFAILVALLLRFRTPQDLTATLMVLAIIVLTIDRRLSAAVMNPIPTSCATLHQADADVPCDAGCNNHHLLQWQHDFGSGDSSIALAFVPAGKTDGDDIKHVRVNPSGDSESLRNSSHGNFRPEQVSLLRLERSFANYHARDLSENE